MGSLKISVIMPALNEERAISASVANVLAGFSRFGLVGELIIVNDGSCDRTGDIALDLSSQYGNIKVINHSTPIGIGAAFRDGLRVASGELVVYIPGDGENNAEEIFRYVPLMETVDIVIPYVTNSELRQLHRRAISSLYHFIMTKTFSIPVRYMNGNVLYRRVILDGVSFSNNGFFYQAELLIKVLRRQYLYAEVPCLLQKGREDGKSKSVGFKSLLTVVRGYIGLVWEHYFSHKENQFLSPLSVTAQKKDHHSVNCICQ